MKMRDEIEYGPMLNVAFVIGFRFSKRGKEGKRKEEVFLLLFVHRAAACCFHGLAFVKY